MREKFYLLNANLLTHNAAVKDQLAGILHAVDLAVLANTHDLAAHDLSLSPHWESAQNFPKFEKIMIDKSDFHR